MNCTSVHSFRNALRSGLEAVPRYFRNSLDYQLSYALSDISEKEWNSLNFSRSTFLDYQHLQALSASEHTDVKFIFAKFVNEETPVGIAVFQIALLEADNLHERIGKGRFAEMLGRKFAPKNGLPYILICGSAFATGEHGYSFNPIIPSQKAMNGLCEALTEIIRNEDRPDQSISAMLIKDFYQNKFKEAKALEKCGFRSFDVDHNMEMPILENWLSFDDYLQDLNSKFRTKANGAFKKSEPLSVQFFNQKQIIEHQDKIQELYDAVHDKADFKIGHLNSNILAGMKEKLGDDMIFRAYFLEEQIIGFSIALDAPDQLEAFIVGIDYKVNTSYALYSRMLYDYIDTAISRRKNKIVFGRTAGEIKSTVGAFPIQLKCCIRHPGRLPNVLLNIIFKYVEPSSFPTRNPYKETTFKKIQALGYHY